MNIPRATEDAAFGTPSLDLGPTRRNGSAASRDAAAGEDADGTTGARMRSILNTLRPAGALGMTWSEVGKALGLHHGQATGALSKLHAAGLVARLATVRRGRSSVYVLPEFIDGRAVAKYSGKVTRGALNLSADEIRFVEQFITVADARPGDKPMMISATSAKALAAILRRALNEVR